MAGVFDLLKPGARNRRIAIIRAMPEGPRSPYGERRYGPPQRTEVMAAMVPAPGIERFQSAENAASAVMRFVMLWRRDLVRVTDTIEVEGRSYAIHSAIEVGYREGIEVLASARAE